MIPPKRLLVAVVLSSRVSVSVGLNKCAIFPVQRASFIRVKVNHIVCLSDMSFRQRNSLLEQRSYMRVSFQRRRVHSMNKEKLSQIPSKLLNSQYEVSEAAGHFLQEVKQKMDKISSQLQQICVVCRKWSFSTMCRKCVEMCVENVS